MKAIITTLLIVGTFIMCWMPAVIWFIVYCKDCVLPIESPPNRYVIGISITVNCLIVLKAFLDPIIYTARMKDFKVSSISALSIQSTIQRRLAATQLSVIKRYQVEWSSRY